MLRPYRIPRGQVRVHAMVYLLNQCFLSRMTICSPGEVDHGEIRTLRVEVCLQTDMQLEANDKCQRYRLQECQPRYADRFDARTGLGGDAGDVATRGGCLRIHWAVKFHSGIQSVLLCNMALSTGGLMLKFSELGSVNHLPNVAIMGLRLPPEFCRWHRSRRLKHDDL
ncbi:hypothetical protein BDV38DRAFT_142925 [Aspergillus pseudotamarii]|uniref:Uncharacterized protein n=1 Tax=Aspergillus pseudotamarii TaxID=132259 RepID=A0A5N6SKC5_ASPPS|nr:uncharacterized protein BDV38DRAFT_142925 [Aspergillus pseudotamarii]KAE8135148.1 hypothetical protein BDV38DRAFT_142925 [Aspergillus pseudotamarii]